MEIFCPNCSCNIDADSINVQTDLAKCNACGSIHKLSEIIKTSGSQINDDKLVLPSGSRITASNTAESAIEFYLPAAGFKGANIPLLGFSIVWLAFITFWTAMASLASIGFASASIPFWVVGLGILLLSITSAKERQEIRIDKEYFTIRKFRPVKSKIVQIPLTDIENIALERFRSIASFNMRPASRNYRADNFIPSLVPVISYGVNKESFFENSSEAERKFMVIILNRIIKKLKKDGYIMDFNTLS